MTLVLLFLLPLAGCGDAEPLASDDPADEVGAPPGVDTAEPFPLDRGDDGPHTPGSYKGLPLRLADTGTPTVTPVDGVVGVVWVGMSNARQECEALREGVATRWGDDVRPHVRIVNCAVGGHAVERWIDPAYDPVLWDACLGEKVQAAGIRPEQVRVVLHKAANQFTRASDGSALPYYPDPASDFFAFRENLGRFAARVPEELPSVQAVYTSSRSFGGFTSRPDRGEPLSYEEGHALNAWLGSDVPAGGPWHGWGPYIWAPGCGSGQTNGSGVCYRRSDFEADAVHPSADGERKIARLWHERLRAEAWYGR